MVATALLCHMERPVELLQLFKKRALPNFCRAVVEAGLAPRAAGDMLAVKVKRHARDADVA